MKTLILYSSRDGQTQKIASFISQQLNDKANVILIPLTDKTVIDFSNISSVVIGASIRYGHFNKCLYQFIKRYSSELNSIPSAFFSVNLTARKQNKNTPSTNVYTRKFLQKINWKPDMVEVFAGALYYPRYKLFDRIMIQFIMRITGGETDTTKEIEYTDWQKVNEFAGLLKDRFYKIEQEKSK